MTTRTVLALSGMGLIFVLGLGVGRYSCTPPMPKPSQPLPPKVVTVTVVKEIPSKEGKIVEHIKWQTKEIPVPVEVIREIPKLINPLARVRVEASKFQGLKAGHEVFGWEGKAICEIGQSTEDKSSHVTTPWLVLAESPFDLTQSSAETTLPPGQPRLSKLRLDAGLGVGSRGAFLAAGLAKRIVHRTRLAQALLPDWVGGQIEYSGQGDSRILALLGKEW